MPAYTSRRFGGLVISSCVIGILLLGLIGWGIFSFLPIRRIVAYYQLVNYDLPSSKPSVALWARVNHTIIILDNNIVESLLAVTAKESPPYQDVIFEIDFDDPRTYTEDDPTPQILEGTQSWSGRFGEDIQVNQTVTIYIKLRFDFDAKYSIRGLVGGSSERLVTLYYVTVEQGKIVKVTDELGRTPPSTEIETSEIHP